ncbi:hypothetical protein JW906_11980 [bacterium]|nr:hypothetical protein [bacterium]
MDKTIPIFIGGIIQGSQPGTRIHDQEYRQTLKRMIRNALPDAEIFCPYEAHPDSVSYPDDKARRIFMEHIRKIRESRLLVVYIPQASMGCAIEMWEAVHAGVPVVSISPLSANWIVRLFSDMNCGDLKEFGEWAGSGGLDRLIRAGLPKQNGAGS